jgi:hypothetical protein
LVANKIVKTIFSSHLYDRKWHICDAQRMASMSDLDGGGACFEF